MPENNNYSFNHLKIHSQYSICEGALKIEDLKNYCKENKIQAVGLSDTSNLCGALEFAENLSKAGTQPIIGTQINFKFKEIVGLLPLFAMNVDGYKRIIELSSKSYLENDGHSDPYCNFSELAEKNDGIVVFSGSIDGLIGKLFNQGKYQDINEIYSNLNSNYKDRFYIEIQRHNDLNEKAFEKFNLKKSKDLDVSIIATNEVFYLDQSMHEAHDALICIGKKSLSHFKIRKYNIIEDYIDFWSELGFQHAISIGEKIISYFISGEADEVQVIYNKFINDTNKLNIYISFVSILYLSYSTMNYTEFISIALFCIEIVQIK